MQAKRSYWPLLILTLTIFSLWSLNALAADVPKITKDALKEKLDNPEVVIIDVREGNDWKTSPYKIKGAVREEAADVKTWADKYPMEKTLVMYCA